MTNLPLVHIDAVPQSVEEFLALRDAIAHTPEGGAAAMVAALLTFAEGERLGQQCLAIAVDRETLQEGPNGYDGWQLGIAQMRLVKGQLRAMPHLPRSYVQGTAPENAYRLPAPPYVVACSTNPYSGEPESGTLKVFVACSGADSPRPVTLKRNNRGIWKAAEWSSLVTGIRPPVADVDDTL
ncbi:MAG: hypothetical protein JXD18_08850 [Anaerolineae bacterium]|nr:hypothetical protein [Anaerolineae bacterium]